ncbi:MAG: hypothetical protein WC408_03665 [Candidatus Micrarchaeia archaeon]|jgi:type II secretory pathway pseudopilin PulG
MAAPIELFIAVIIMSVSMAIVFNNLSHMSDTQCEFKLKVQNEKLQAAMQRVSIGSWDSSETVDYVMERCTSDMVEGVRIAHYSKPSQCISCAGNYGGGCWVIEPLTYTLPVDGSGLGILEPIQSARVCIELSESLNLAIDTTCSGTVSGRQCPKTVAGEEISDADCNKMTFASTGIFDTANLATFERNTATSSSFKIKITKGSTAEALSGTAGQLLICVNQN